VRFPLAGVDTAMARAILVLLVEDGPVLPDIIRSAFEASGCDVVVAENGSSAIRGLLKLPPS
jgi:CheY-like chemotaxis protein